MGTHQIQDLSIKDDLANVGRDDRTCLARPNSQAQTETGKISFSLFN